MLFVLVLVLVLVLVNLFDEYNESAWLHFFCYFFSLMAGLLDLESPEGRSFRAILSCVYLRGHGIFHRFVIHFSCIKMTINSDSLMVQRSSSEEPQKQNGAPVPLNLLVFSFLFLLSFVFFFLMFFCYSPFLSSSSSSFSSHRYCE